MDVREKPSNVKRLIDADTLLDEFLKRYTGMERKGNLVFAACEIKQDFADMISNFTTVDAVEVVRCRKCKHCRKMIGNSYHYCVTHNTKMYAEDFCSYGERKEGAD